VEGSGLGAIKHFRRFSQKIIKLEINLRFLHLVRKTYRSTLENHQLNQLTSALKQQMFKEIQEINPKNSIKSSSGLSNPGEFQTYAKHNLSIFLLVK
jgi:hypothetical protein